MSEPKNLIDRFNLRIRNNPVVAVLIVLGTIVIALSSFTNATKNLLGLVVKDTRPAINGEWRAEVTYDWPNANHTETFTFSGEGDAVHGTASFLGVKRGVVEGKAQNDRLQFVTRTPDSSGDALKESVHHYQGKVLRDEITFVMQTQGGFSEHTPIEFVAKRVTHTSP